VFENSEVAQIASAQSAITLMDLFYKDAFEALVSSSIVEDGAKVDFIDNYVDKLCYLYEEGINNPDSVFPKTSVSFENLEPLDEELEDDETHDLLTSEEYMDLDWIKELRAMHRAS